MTASADLIATVRKGLWNCEWAVRCDSAEMEGHERRPCIYHDALAALDALADRLSEARLQPD